MGKEPVFRKVIDVEETKQILHLLHRDRGYPSGYKGLDKMAGGLVRDGVTLIAGRPGMGKTSLALNMIHRLSMQQEGTILIFTPDVLPGTMTIRLLSIGLQVMPQKILNNSLPPAQIARKCNDFLLNKKSAIEFIPNSYPTLGCIEQFCKNVPDLRMVLITPANAICKPIDYAARADKAPEKEDFGVVFPQLQKLAKQLGVPVLCTANLHRSLENRKDKRPKLTDLKKVGIPQDAVDEIIFLYRDRYYDYMGEEGAEWIVAKAPNGNAGTIYMDRLWESGCFLEKDRDI